MSYKMMVWEKDPDPTRVDRGADLKDLHQDLARLSRGQQIALMINTGSLEKPLFEKVMLTAGPADMPGLSDAYLAALKTVEKYLTEEQMKEGNNQIIEVLTQAGHELPAEV